MTCGASRILLVIGSISGRPCTELRSGQTVPGSQGSLDLDGGTCTP